MVVVGDDIALPDLPQPRGVAGTLFVHKIAGDMAENGVDLDNIHAAAQQTIDATASIGMSLDTCTMPGAVREDRIPAGKAELGLGIHGEAGVEQVAHRDAAQAMDMMLDKLASHIGGKEHVAILNNLGGTTPLEMSVLAHELATNPKAKNIKHVVGPGEMMTALDMHGFSVSVLPVSKGNKDHLLADVGVSAWPGMKGVGAVTVQPLPDGLSPIQPIASQNAKVRGLIEQVCDLLAAAEGDLNALDAKSGDGDTGSTLSTAAHALKGSLDRMPLADLTQLFRALSNELSQTMGGSSGIILSIFFGATGDACANGMQTPAALLAGLERISQVGGARAGDRTMIDALEPALKALPDGISAAAAAARKGADHTASIGRAKAGRSSYVPEENLIGHNDPGAEAVARLFEGLSAAM